eukprot:2511311-Prymnesium_polylepis.1
MQEYGWVFALGRRAQERLCVFRFAREGGAQSRARAIMESAPPPPPPLPSVGGASLSAAVPSAD